MTPLPAVDPDLEQQGPASDLITEWLAEGGGGSVAWVSPLGWLGEGTVNIAIICTSRILALPGSGAARLPTRPLSLLRSGVRR